MSSPSPTPPPLSAALQAWLMQGPTLLRSALSAKDAEIARLAAERDAHVAEAASLRACVASLQHAVDQLAALCTAQVAELALHADSDPDPDPNATNNPIPQPLPTIAPEQHHQANLSRQLSAASSLHDLDQQQERLSRQHSSVSARGHERLSRKPSSASRRGYEDDQERLSRKPSAASDSAAAQVFRRGSFPGASEVSSTHLSPVEHATLPVSDADTNNWDVHAEQPRRLPPSYAWDARRATAAAPPRAKQPLAFQLQKGGDALNTVVEESAVSDLPPDMEHFDMDDGTQMRLPILARHGSDFVDVNAAGQCVVKDAAFCVSGAALPCTMTVTLEPERVDHAIATLIQFEYPDATMLPFLPVCGLRICGGLLSYEERAQLDARRLADASAYGRDYVRLQMDSRVYTSLVRDAQKLIRDLYPDAEFAKMAATGEGEEMAEVFAQVMSPHPVMRGKRWDASIEELLMESDSDIAGDGTIVMRFLERCGETELDFVLHRMQLEDDQGMVRSVV